MTMLDTTARIAASDRLGDWIVAPVERVLARLAAWNDARVTRAMLSRLSAHELDDIGLCRGDLDSIASLGAAIPRR